MSNKYFNNFEQFRLTNGRQVELQVNEVDMKPTDEFRLRNCGYRLIKVPYIGGILIERSYINWEKKKIYLDIKELERKLKEPKITKITEENKNE